MTRVHVKWMTQASRSQGLARPRLHADRILCSDLAVDDWRSVLYCFSAADGRVIWQVTLPEPGASAIGGVVAGVVFFYRTYEEEGHVRAYSLETGDLVWENEQMHWMAVIGDRAVAACWSNAEWALALIEPRTGDVIWRRPVRVGTWPEALVDDVTVMIEESGYQERSVVVGARLADGAEVWRTDLERFSRVVTIAPGEHRAYCATSDGWLVALDVGNGEVVWARQFEGGTPQRPAIARGRAYTTTQGFFHGVDAKVGTVVVHARWKELLLGEGCVDNQRYYAASNDCLVAFDLDTGKEVWRHQGEEGESFVSPTVHAGQLYAATLNGRLYCFDVNGAVSAI